MKELITLKKLTELFGKHHIGIIRVLMIGINLFLLYWALMFTTILQFYLAIIAAVVINGYYVLHEILTFHRQNHDKRYDRAFQFVLEAMPYAEPLNEEIFDDALKKPFEPLSNETPTDEAGAEERSEDYVSEEDEATVETVEILRPKEIIEKEPSFEQSIESDQYALSLREYMKDNGLSVEINTIREMFASLASSKLMVFRHKNPEITERFLEIFTDFIGANFYSDALEDEDRSIADLLSGGHAFKECLERAHADRNKLNILSLNGVDLHRFQKHFQELIAFALKPNVSSTLDEILQAYQLTMPSNIGIALLAQEVETASLDESFLKSAVFIDVEATPVKPKETVYQNSVKLSYQTMRNLFNEGMEQHYLDEDEWKKFDQIEGYLNQRADFQMDNQLFIRLERYASTFLLFGGDNHEAVDRLLFSKFLPIASTIDFNGNEQTEEAMLDLFEKLFGLENLNKSKALLKAMHTNHTTVT